MLLFSLLLHQEALSNVVENALKFCKMGRGGAGGNDGGDRPTVVLRARSSTDEESWGADRWVLGMKWTNGP